ncbi:MAG: hypothetical protein P8Y62_04570 [candidate division WOR-3 bacterium]
MRKLIYVAILVLPLFVFGEIGIGVPASEEAEFQFVIPEVVGVEISDANIEWDFSSMAGFPPAAFPAQYEPTTPAARPYQTIDYFVWGFGGASWELTIAGNGDPSPACGIALGDIEYAEDDGAGALVGGWTALTTSAAVIESGSANTGGWATTYQDYQVNIDGNETNTGGSNCTVTYTIQTL